MAENKQTILIKFESDQDAMKGSETDENLSTQADIKPAVPATGAKKTNLTKQVADAVLLSKMRSSVVTIFNKAAQYSGDYISINYVNNVGSMYSISSSFARAALSGSFLDFANVMFDQTMQVVDLQIQKDKQNIKSEFIKQQTGMTSYMRSRNGGKKV